ncbi:MAG: DotA/TraY family protein, partial [Rhodocyclaceae bacterium]|nr:DotA/TraY family protein [Rhodocyclaceae bacterium]
LWEPIRVVWGLATLVPTVNGWSLAQLLMLWAASVMGVGVANLGVDAALAAFNDGKSMVVQPVAPDTIDLSRNVFESYLCMHGINALLDKARNEDSALITDDSYIKENTTGILGASGSGYILENSSATCGGAKIKGKSATSALLPGSGISTYAIYDPSIVKAIYDAHVTELGNMRRTLSPKAQAFIQVVQQRRLGEAVELPNAHKAILDAANKYEEGVNKVAQTALGDIEALAKKIQESIKDGGWWMLGAWYQTFAQANTKLSDVVAGKASTTGMSFKGDTAMRETFEKWFKEPYDTHMLKAEAKQSATTSTLGQQAVTKSADTKSAAATKSDPTDMSEIVGLFSSQRLLTWMTDGNDERQQNPIIRAKDLGDRLMVVSEGALATWGGIRAYVAGAKRGIIGSIVDFTTGLGEAAATFLTTVSPFVTGLIIVIFFLGATLSVYIPLVPFIIWFGAIINWLVVVGEAVVAAPLWAMIHLAGEGDGFGHKTSHGYIFLLNCMVRPILMVIGFFLGGAAVVVGGTMLNQTFKVAVANVQFDSMTGLFSILGFIFVYLIMFLNLVHSCFNLIFIVPDQVINWVGGHAAPHIGRDENDRTRQAVGAVTHRAE